MKKTVQIQCCGRDSLGQGVLDAPIDVLVDIARSQGSSFISVQPKNCPYNVGGHRQRCAASHPEHHKVGDGISCPFSFDYPYCTRSPGWKMPVEMELPVKEIMDSVE